MKQRLCVLCQQILHVLAEGLGQRWKPFLNGLRMNRRRSERCFTIPMVQGTV
jgi:hypothetical protein